MKFARRLLGADPRRGLALLAAGLVIGAVGGYLFGWTGVSRMSASVAQSFAPIREGGVPYQFVRPLLAYRTPEATALGQYGGLDASIQSIINASNNSGATSRVSAYFRDLDAGTWLGFSQNETYYPASLLKVPVMIAYFKQSEEDPSVLDQTFAYDPSVLPSNPFDATSTLVAGRTYTVEQLIESMVSDSDNGATFTLLNRINPAYLHDVYIGLGVQDPGDNSQNYQISARNYALFFRILFNATYLSAQDSEKALKLLSQTTFDSGLVAGVPEGTPVAHKWGEHVLTKDSTAVGVELSDCGIIYYPSHPYLLCVMTSASDLPSAESVISKISSAAYAAVAQE